MLIYDFAFSPRVLTAKGEGFEEDIGEIPSVYKWEITNRGVHAAARGGNLKILKELFCDYTDVLAYRDKWGSTVIHATANRGQVEVVKNLVASFNIIDSIDDQGSDFQTPIFRRVDQQINLMKQLIHAKNFNMEDIVNAKNNDGRIALHMAIIGNVHTDLVKLMMSAQSINVNISDGNGMTPLDLLRQRPRSISSNILIRHLISAGEMFGCQDYTARRAIASHLKVQGHRNNLGTSFKIFDIEIFLYTGVETTSDASDFGSGGIGHSSLTDFDSGDYNRKL
ncbi:hypothetical protein CRYUN_Cryun02cG0093600 [Craigia yunnanensis]